MSNSGAGNINESFVLDNLRILMDQNILNKLTSFGDSYYILESNRSAKCNIPIDYKRTMTKPRIVHTQKISLRHKVHQARQANVSL